jgi:hypothetical protein
MPAIPYVQRCHGRSMALVSYSQAIWGAFVMEEVTNDDDIFSCPDISLAYLPPQISLQMIDIHFRNG